MAPRFFVPEARPDHPIVDLPSAEAHHLRHVLRLGAGADVFVFDGRGREWAGRVAGAGRARVTIELVREVPPIVEPRVTVTLGIGLLKGDQMDAVVRDATALGVATIAPIVSEHVAVGRRARAQESARVRWERVAIAAARQCGRSVVPAIAPVRPLDAVVEAAGSLARYLCVEPARQGAQAIAPAAIDRPDKALVIVGPEGGWSAAEVDRAVARGLSLVHLGPRTLRADLAPAVLLSALWTVWGW